MTQRSTDALPADVRPLAGITVVDFSQFLAGPAAGLRLADLGARVIKIERPAGGDICRQLSFGGLDLDGDTLEFHCINRNKESYAADLKDPTDLAGIRTLIAHADVVIENFRPGVMRRAGLDYESVRAFAPSVVYGSVTGYGTTGPWRGKPGQDLLVQSLSGLPWLSGSRDHPPVPVGLAIADLFASTHLAQGILALLIRRERQRIGGHVEVSLLESILDLQMEVITAFLADAGQGPERGPRFSAHPYLCAPYGVYPTRNGYLAVAMNPVPRLGELLDLPALTAYTDPRAWFAEQDTISGLLAERLSGRTTQHWLDILEPADVWCAEVLTISALMEHDGFAAVAMTQDVYRRTADDDRLRMRTTRCPIRVDGQLLVSDRGAPRLGANTESIRREFEVLDESQP